MKLNFEYGHGTMAAELPDELTDVFIPGETVPDPPYIPEDQLVERRGNLFCIPLEWSRSPNWQRRGAR